MANPRSVSTRRSSGPRVVVSQMPSQAVDGIFPRIELTDFVSLSRGSAPNRNRNYTIQPNVSMIRGKHNIRSGLDLRWINTYHENYNNSGGIVRFNQQFTRSTMNSTSVLEGNSFASFLLGAPVSGEVDVNPKPHYEWFFAAPWIQDDWRVNNKLTLNLGFRWDFNGAVGEADNMLNYAFDPTLVNPVSARVGQQVLGGIRFAGVDGAPDRAMEVRQEQLPVPRRHGLLDQRQDRAARRLGQVLPQPDQYVVQRRVRPVHADHHVARRQPDADLCAEQSVAHRNPEPARQRARTAHLPRAQSELLEP